jgi:hypothetical protein
MLRSASDLNEFFAMASLAGQGADYLPVRVSWWEWMEFTDNCVLSIVVTCTYQILWLQEGKMYGICNTRNASDEFVLNLNWKPWIKEPARESA